MTIDSAQEGAPPDTPTRPARPLVWITPSRRWYDIDPAELWRHRDLLGLLAVRDVKLRYTQTVLGILWAFIQPLVPMIVFTLVFSRALSGDTGGVPYPLFALAGLLPWTFFSSATTNSGNSLLMNAHMISKVYFPRLILPAAAVLSAGVDFAISSILVLGLMAYYRAPFHPAILLAVPLAVAAAVLAFAVGTIVSSFNIVYRDVRHAFPFVIQVWMFLTPVIYSSTTVPEKWRWIVALNPVAGIVEAFRAVLFGLPLPLGALGYSLAATAVVTVAALVVFGRMERHLADFV